MRQLNGAELLREAPEPAAVGTFLRSSWFVVGGSLASHAVDQEAGRARTAEWCHLNSRAFLPGALGPGTPSAGQANRAEGPGRAARARRATTSRDRSHAGMAQGLLRRRPARRARGRDASREVDLRDVLGIMRLRKVMTACGVCGPMLARGAGIEDVQGGSWPPVRGTGDVRSPQVEER